MKKKTLTNEEINTLNLAAILAFHQYYDRFVCNENRCKKRFKQSCKTCSHNHIPSSEQKEKLQDDCNKLSVPVLVNIKAQSLNAYLSSKRLDPKGANPVNILDMTLLPDKKRNPYTRYFADCIKAPNVLTKMLRFLQGRETVKGP